MKKSRKPISRRRHLPGSLKLARRRRIKITRGKRAKINIHKKTKTKHRLSIRLHPYEDVPVIPAIPLNSKTGQRLLTKNQQSLSVIISVHDEEATIRDILNLAMELRPKEIIIVENGSTDRTLEICKEYPVRCFSYSARLGHDVGRAVGAREATGDVLLFLDGDLPLDPSSLLPFAKLCYEGAEIALNNLDPYYKDVTTIDYVSMAKHYLNCLMSRRDLGFCSLTAIPHAMTKSAALAIGVENLSVPPKAQAIALYQGRKVEKAATVDVFRTNKLRSYHNEIGEMILGDHIEAIHWLQSHSGKRMKSVEPIRIRADAAQGTIKKYKIVHVLSNAPFAYPLPPLDQGGTEKVLYDLTEEVVQQGHEVYVFAPSGSTSSARVIEYPSDLDEESIGEFVSRNLPPGIDIINDFTFSSSVKKQRLPVPTVSTHQCALGWFTDKSIYPSIKMRSTAGGQNGFIVYNGIKPEEYEYNEQKKDYLLFIGRVVREKGVLEAIHVATQTNHKLKIAGPIKDEQLFTNEIEPLLRNNPNIEYVGPVSGQQKQELFKNAKCLLFPITWEEPFGLVMIEAMATGTPVLAFNRGSVSEVLAGFPQLICNDIDEMKQKVVNSDFPSPQQLRHYVVARFSRQAMAGEYLKIYADMIRRPRRSKPASALRSRLRKRRSTGRRSTRRIKRSIRIKKSAKR